MDCGATIPLSVQQISNHNVYPIIFYEPLNVQNRMCELCTFSEIRSHIMYSIYDYTSQLIQFNLLMIS